MQWIVEKVKSLLYYGSCTILVIVLAGLVLLFFFQNSLIYMPVIPGMSRYPHENPKNFRDPKAQGLDFEDVNITTSDNIQLHGWFVPCKHKETARTVVYYHENAGSIHVSNADIGFRIPYLKIYSRSTDSNILLVAYRGYSNSGGIPTENGIKLDGEAIFKFISQMKGIDHTKIYIHGRSLGGAVAVHVASKMEWGSVRGVILENTFTSMSDMVDVVFGRLKHVKHLLLRNYWKSIDTISQVKAPIFFMKGNYQIIKAALDELVPLSHMNKLVSAAKSHGLQVQQYLMEGATHNQTWELDSQGYFGKLIEFFESCQSVTVGIKHGRSMPRDETQM